MENGKGRNGLWLATLGYLVVPQIVSRTIAKKRNLECPDRNKGQRTDWKQFRAGLLEFAPKQPLSEENCEALWSLRCALAHHWGLRNTYGRKEWRFGLAQHGSLCRAFEADNATYYQVNIHKVASYIEGIVKRARSEHRAGHVQLAPGRGADEVLLASYVITPAPGASTRRPIPGSYSSRLRLDSPPVSAAAPENFVRVRR